MSFFDEDEGGKVDLIFEKDEFHADVQAQGESAAKELNPAETAEDEMEGVKLDDVAALLDFEYADLDLLTSGAAGGSSSSSAAPKRDREAGNVSLSPANLNNSKAL